MKRVCWILGCMGWSINAARAQTEGSLRLIADKPTYQEYQLQLPSPEPSGYEFNDTIWARYFVPRGVGPFPAVLVLHCLGTDQMERERQLCRKLLRQGIASLLPSLPYHGGRAPEDSLGGRWMISTDLEQTIRALHQAIADARACVDWLAGRPEINAQQMGLLGLSLGAILATPVLGQEPRLRAGVLLLGGGDLVKLLRKSLILGGLRLDWRKQNLTAAELRARCHEVEPLNYAAAVRGRTLLMVNGYYDALVPTDCSNALWEALGRPQRIRINAGHYGGFFYSNLLFDQAVLFLTASLRGRPISLGKLRSITEFPAPKIELVRLEGKDVRPGVALEMLWLDRQKNLSIDVGWTPSRFFAGLSLDVASIGHSPVADLGLGYAVSIHGQGDPYVALGLHF